jgi:nicotinate-nucleotide pyrophosphorylase
VTDRIPLDDMTSDQLDQLYALLDERWDRIVKQSGKLQELKRDNFALRMDIVSLLEDKLPSEITPGEISAARRNK